MDVLTDRVERTGPGAAIAVPFDIDEVLARACAGLDEQAQRKGLEFVVHRSRDVPQLLAGDPIRLGRVLLHLARNAVRFTSAGEVSVAIECEAIDDAGGQALLKFSVTDTGIGVGDPVAARFGAAAPARQPEAPGRGLAAVDEMVRAMGGSLELATAPGIGSDFSFAARFAFRRGGTTPSFAGLRVLLVDDNDTARAAVQHLLAASGCRVTAASDGTEALQAMHAAVDAPADMLLVDADLAGMDGLEAVRAILRCLPVPHPPVIAMVAPSLREEVMARAKRLALPVDVFLGKPVKARELYRVLAALGAAPAGAAEARPAGARIDARGALEMLGGNAELLERVLADFSSSEAGTAGAVEEMIRAGRLEEAGHRVHSAKGTAMVLGLEGFVQAAAEIERALREGDREGSRMLLVPFARELAAAVHACAAAREEQARRRDTADSRDADAELPSPQVLQPLLDGLAALLDRHSMSAIEAAQQIHALLAGTCCAALAAEIKTCLLRLDFAEASRRLDGLGEQVAASR